MVTHHESRSAQRLNLVNEDSIFEPPPLLEGEDIRAYNALLRRVTNDVKPRDTLEIIWVRDVVDLTWEVFRWRRLATEWLSSHWIQDAIDIVERIDRLAMLAEARRNSAIREIGHHRSAFAENLRQTINQVSEANVKAIETKNASAPKTAKRKKAA